MGTQAMQRQSHRDSHTVPGEEISLDTLRFFLTTTGAALEGVRGWDDVSEYARGCLSDRSNETAEEGKLEVKKNSAGTMNLYLCSNCTLLNNIYKQWVAQ